MKPTALILILTFLLLTITAEAQKPCRCRGKRGPRGPRGLKGLPGATPVCQLVHETGPQNTQERNTGELNFVIPQISIGSTCPTGSRAVSCDCHINSFGNGGEQVRTKIIGWGTLDSFCLCNYEYLPGFAETVEVSAQAHCIKLECS